MRRMFERSIGVSDVMQAIEAGETIEDYPDDTPYPSRLVLARIAGQPLHIVVADNEARQMT